MHHGWPVVPAPWLVARPIAHRGLHDRTAGRRENTLSSARAAIAAGFAIECDVQTSADGDAMVFHDFDLDRLTGESGSVRSRSARAVEAISIGGTSDRVPRLTSLLQVIAGQVPLICEIKSLFDGDLRLADRVAAIAADYPGPFAVKSFDPAVIAHLRKGARPVPLGIVAEARYDDPEWSMLTPAHKRDLAAFLHVRETRPDFVSYAVNDLPHASASLFRLALGLPVMSWTVRTEVQREQATQWADQMIFEGFVP